jgi:hypothetical protein
MADNPRYSDTGIGYSGAPITQGVDPIGVRARAQATGDISSILDRMAGSLYKVAAEEAQREGLQWGAANPVTVDQLNAAVAAGNDPLAERHTYFGEAARKVQASILGQNLNSQGVGEMARIQAEAEIGKIPLSVAAEKMDAVSNAYSKTLAGVDPETGIKLRAALTTHSSSVYAHLAQQEVKKFQAAQKASIDEYFTKLPKTLETVYLAGDITGPDGITKTAGDLAQVQRAQAVQAARITGDASYGTRFDKAHSEARISAYTALTSSYDFATNPIEALAKIEAGNFDPQHRASWAAMTSEEQTKVKEQTVKAFAQRYDVISKTQSANDLQAKKGTQALQIEFYSPGTPAARKTQILAEIKSLGVISPSDYKSMIKGDDETMSKTREAEVADMIDTGAITSFTQLKRVASGAALVRLQRNLRVEGNQTEKQAEGIILEAVAGTKSPVAALNAGQQEEKYNLQNRYRAEVDAAKAAGTPFSYRDLATKVADEYKAKRFSVQLKEEREVITKIEAEIGVEPGSLKTATDVANLDAMGKWKGKEGRKKRALSALNAINTPVLIPETPQK